MTLTAVWCRGAGVGRPEVGAGRSELGGWPLPPGSGSDGGRLPDLLGPAGFPAGQLPAAAAQPAAAGAGSGAAGHHRLRQRRQRQRRLPLPPGAEAHLRPGRHGGGSVRPSPVGHL